MFRNVRFHSNSSTWIMSPNHYDFDEIAVILEGQGISTTDNREIPLTAGTTLLIPAGTVHGGMALEPIRFAVITYYSRYLSSYSSLLYRMLHMKNLKKIVHTQMDENTLVVFVYHFRCLQEELQLKRTGWEEASRLHMEAMLLLLYRLFDRTGYPSDDIYQPIWHAARVIEEHFREQIKIEELANNYHMSPSAFREKFKSFFGVSPKQYLMNIRLDEAKRYLRHTKLSITEICMNTGFSSIQQFNSKFKDREGLSPQRWRSPKANKRKRSECR